MMASPRLVHAGVLAWGVGTQGCGETGHGTQDTGIWGCVCVPLTGMRWGSCCAGTGLWGHGGVGTWEHRDMGT